MIEFDDYADSKRLYREHTLHRTDPYGLWVILDPKGRLLKGVDGSFTNPQDAAKALDVILNKTERNSLEVASQRKV